MGVEGDAGDSQVMALEAAHTLARAYVREAHRLVVRPAYDMVLEREGRGSLGRGGREMKVSHLCI